MPMLKTVVVIEELTELKPSQDGQSFGQTVDFTIGEALSHGSVIQELSIIIEASEWEEMRKEFGAPKSIPVVGKRDRDRV